MICKIEAKCQGATHCMNGLFLKFDGFHWFILEKAFDFFWTPVQCMYDAELCKNNAITLN